MRFIFGPLIIFGGLMMMKYTVQITHFTGEIDWAEKYFSKGLGAGTFSFWRTVGLIIALLGFFWLVGWTDWLGQIFAGTLGFRT